MLPIINTAVFLTVAFMHGLRLGTQTPVVIGGVEVALWLSFLAVVGTLLLAWYNWRTLKKPGTPEILKLLFVLLLIDIGCLFYSWFTGLVYWGIGGETFAWFILFDLIAIGIIANFIKKKTA
jgi:hypothetical protein